MAKEIAVGAREAGPGVGLNVPPRIARAACLVGWKDGMASPPDSELSTGGMTRA